jgi:hypothetical protein
MNYRAALHEFSQKTKSGLVLQTTQCNNGWQCTAVLGGKPYSTSPIMSNKVEAEEFAARLTYQTLTGSDCSTVKGPCAEVSRSLKDDLAEFALLNFVNESAQSKLSALYTLIKSKHPNHLGCFQDVALRMAFESESSHEAALKEIWNKLMHAANGNHYELLIYSAIESGKDNFTEVWRLFAERFPSRLTDQNEIYTLVSEWEWLINDGPIPTWIAAEQEARSYPVWFGDDALLPDSPNGWIPDLTTQGIEPNPGPSKSEQSKPARQHAKPGSRQAEKKLTSQVVALKKDFKAEKKKVNQVKQASVQNRNKAHSQKAKSEVNQVIKSEAKEFKKVTSMIALPLTNRTVRVPDLAATKTAIANPFSIEPVEWATTDSLLPVNQCAYFLFRNALRSFIKYMPNAAGAPFDYQLYFNDADTNTVTNFTKMVNYTQNSESLIPNVVYAKCLSDYAPHGQIWFPGRVKGTSNCYFWMDTGVSLTIIPDANTLTGTETAYFFLRKYRGGASSDDFEIGTIAAGSSTPITYVIPSGEAGYYSFSLYYKDTAGAVIPGHAITFHADIFATNAATWGHRAIPDLDNNLLAVDKIRVLSAAVLYMERASPLNAQGSIISAQVPGTRPWTDFLISGYGKIGKIQGVEPLPIKTGAYGFLKPTDPVRDFAYQSGYIVDDGRVMASYYMLDDETDYIATFAAVENADGRDAQFTLSYAVEYQTTDSWRDLDVARVSPEDFNQSVWGLKNVKQFHGNPVHVKEIWNAIKMIASDVTNGMLTYIPKITSMMRILG